MSWLKSHLPKRRRYRIALYLLSILLILLAADMLLVQAWRHIDISPETTHITSPLNADGLPDYIAFHNAQASQGITPDNNAAPAILQIVGTDGYQDPWRNLVLPQLGLPTTASPSQFTTYDVWLRAHHAEEPTTDDGYTMTKTPWTSAENPLRAQWLQTQTPILNKLHDALQKERFYIPWATNTGTSLSGQAIEVQLRWISGLRDCSRALTADTMRAVGEKDFPAFNRDLADQFKLVRLSAQGSTIIEFLVGCVSQNGASQTLQLAATTPDFLTPDQIQTLQRQLDSAPLVPDVSRFIDTGERYFFLDCLCYASLHGMDRLALRVLEVNGSNPATNPISRLLIPIHFNDALRSANLCFDQEVIAAKLPTFHQRQQGFTAAQSEFQNRLNFSYHSISILIPNLNKTIQLQTEAITQISLSKLALALNAYHTAHNEYPKSLNDLAPTFLPSLPTDEFADAPFHYQPTEKGYTLYSVGPDGQDDHGADRTSATPHYDIVVKTNQ